MHRIILILEWAGTQAGKEMIFRDGGRREVLGKLRREAGAITIYFRAGLSTDEPFLIPGPGVQAVDQAKFE